jgi:hypothetical protein
VTITRVIASSARVALLALAVIGMEPQTATPVLRVSSAHLDSLGKLRPVLVSVMLARQRLAKASTTNAKVDSTIALRATGLLRPHRVTILARASQPLASRWASSPGMAEARFLCPETQKSV